MGVLARTKKRVSSTKNRVKRVVKDKGITKENAQVIASCVTGVGLYAVLIEALDTSVGQVSGKQYAGFTEFLYGSTPGQLLSSAGLYYSIRYAQDMMHGRNMIPKSAKGKSQTAAATFAAASALYRLDGGQIASRMNYLSSGSLSAAVNPTGNKAAIMNSA